MRMILADDEPVITSGIQKLVDWNQLGIEIVGVYEDGKSALDAMVRLKPELALLDISMPGLTGIEIIKESQALNLPTKVLFVSGFQDFEYAQSAIHYGAKAYLLKPIIRDELLSAIEDCVSSFSKGIQELEEEASSKGLDYSKLVELEDCCYTPVYADVLIPTGMTEQMEKLVRFSFVSFLEEYLDKGKIGITFMKDNHIAIVFKGKNEEECLAIVRDMWQKSTEATGQKTAFAIGQSVHTMREIPEMFRQCVAMQGYFYFAEMLVEPIVFVDRPVNPRVIDSKRFENVRTSMINAVIEKNREGFDSSFEQYGKLACQMADGKQADACFYMGSAVRLIEERFEKLGITGRQSYTKDLLESFRKCGTYQELLAFTHDIFYEYSDLMNHQMESNDKQSFMHARKYIEEHYQENLTLNILADEIHMNPYYFSAFFKKNAGENFKDYVSRIRIEHAVSMLITTDKKTYEIALENGFSDARNFSEVFRKYYNETPNAYRKRMCTK